METGISLGYQLDTCSVCKKKKEIRIVYDKDSFRMVKVCDKCVEAHSVESVENLIKKYGKKAPKKDVELISKDKFLKV